MNLFGKFPIVRLKQFRDNPSYIWYYIKRLFYYKHTSQRCIPLYDGIIFISPKETMDYLIRERASIARFGDGDIEQLTGAGEYPPDSDWSQRSSRELIIKLEEVLRSNISKLLVAPISPLIFLRGPQDAEDHGVVYNMWTDARLLLHRYLKKGHFYGDANVFMPAHHPDLDWAKLYKYLKDRDVVIVTGGTSNLTDVSLGKRIFFVEAGKHNAFERYDEISTALTSTIENEGLIKEKTTIMASLGPTADILALDFTRKGWQVWDTGHFFKYAHQKIIEIKKYA